MEFYDTVTMASTLKFRFMGKTLQTRGAVLQAIKQLVPVQRLVAVFKVRTKRAPKSYMSR
jgi:hypothetical protein